MADQENELQIFENKQFGQISGKGQIYFINKLLNENKAENSAV